MMKNVIKAYLSITLLIFCVVFSTVLVLKDKEEDTKTDTIHDNTTTAVTDDIIYEAIEEVEAVVIEEIIQEPTINYGDLRIASNTTAEQIDNFLEGSNLAGLGAVYVEAEEIYGVNALLILAICIEESGWGYSDVARDYNNITGTMIRGEYRYFNSFAECIYYTADNLATNYLVEEGIYHNGYSVYDINTKYCFKEDELTGELVPDYQWAVNIQLILREFFNN